MTTTFGETNNAEGESTRSKNKNYGYQIQSEEVRREKNRRQEKDCCQEKVAVRLLLSLLTESGEADSLPNHRVALAAPGSSSVAMKLCQGQVWKQGQQYIRIVRLERLEVEYKSMTSLTTKEGALQVTSKKDFCRLLKTAKLLPPPKAVVTPKIPSLPISSPPRNEAGSAAAAR